VWLGRWEEPLWDGRIERKDWRRGVRRRKRGEVCGGGILAVGERVVVVRSCCSDSFVEARDKFRGVKKDAKTCHGL